MIAGYVFNGRFVRGAELTIRVDQPFFAHGQGLFETLRCFRKRPLFLRAHMARMRTTADRLGLHGVPGDERVGADIALLLESLGFADARVRLHLLCREDGGGDFLIAGDEVPPLAEIGKTIAVDLAAPIFAKGIAMAGLKTMNYMVNRLAEKDGLARGFDEALFALPDGTLLEGTRTSIFFAKHGVLHTPSLELPILPGVTRAACIVLARRLGIEVREGSFPARELAGSDEAFLTGSVSGVRPIGKFGGGALPAAPGPLTRRIAAAYWSMVTSGEDLP